MSYSPRSKNLSPRRSGRKGIALVVVLGLVVIVSLILVAFVTVMSLDRSASASYGQSLAAEQIGQGALNLVVADLRNEMGKDAVPDLTYPAKPLYTNVTAANILPQSVGTNAAMPSLIKISAPTNSFIGSVTSGSLIASSIGTAASSKNGRYLDAARWSAPYLGTFPSTNNLPNWLIITRGGPASGGTFGNTGNTLNNPALSNPNYAIGRVAYAIYDEGSLLDVTVAGHPSSLTPAQINQLKGTLAGADLSAVGITGANVDALVNWRNAASAATTSAYFSYMTNFVATNGFSRVAPGDRTFLSRQDLIKAAQKNIAGLTTANLTNLTTFTREKNAPSWGPQAKVGTPVGNTIDYAGLSKNLSLAVNPFIPYVRHTSAGTVTTYKIDGTATTYSVVPGDPIVSRRFPLDRLKWLGPSGPQNGGTTDSIKACFGLLWDSPTGVWKYVGPSGTTEQSLIKTLSQVVVDHREPNFFELLQAGMLSGSLAMEAHTNAGGTYNINMNYFTVHEKSAALHVFRIGASIISQAQGSIYPTVIEYDQSGQPWQAVGVANLPYLNMLVMLSGKDVDDSLQCYLMLGLSNPHQMPQGTVAARPPIRLRVKGSVLVGNNYGRFAGKGYTKNPISLLQPPYSYMVSLDATVALSPSAGSGANGFIDPHALLTTDIAPALGLGTAAGMEWTALPSIDGKTYAGYRLPNYYINPTDSLTTSPDPTLAAALFSNVWFAVNTNAADPFNCWLEFQNPAGVWVPYNYHAGINNPATWFCKGPGFYAGLVEKPSSNPPVVQMMPMDPPVGTSLLYLLKNYWETVDPRSLRFNYTQPRSVGTVPGWANFMNSSQWSSSTDAVDQPFGHLGLQVIPYLFGAGGWNPASLCRNNTAPQTRGVDNRNKYTAYADPDGVQRIADSGLFTAPPSNVNSWQGDPYAVSATRTSDRPIILNRPFYSVADLGYASRDYPWRTLDFFTANSADAGLLDLFTVDNSTDAVVRGRLNLNTPNTPALTAVLNSTYADVVGATPLSNPSSVASSLVHFSSPATGTPLTGRDQIATKFVPSLTATELGSTDNQMVKARREGVPRALADVTQTRTWNLMIDVVAQAGRYAPGATAADQFVVEGQKRYWLHIAIDRFTGEVIDQQLESVTE